MAKIEFERGNKVVYKPENTSYFATVRAVQQNPMNMDIEYKLAFNDGGQFAKVVTTTGRSIVESEYYHKRG